MEKLNNIWNNHKKIKIAVLVVIILSIVGSYSFMKYQDSKIEVVSYLELQQMVEDKKVEKVEYSINDNLMKVHLYDGTKIKATYPSYEEFTKDMLECYIGL